MRFALPIPIIEPETTCVVLTGKESNVAEKIMTEEFKSAAKPDIGWSLKIRPPTVLIIYQPPIAVPQAIAVAAKIFT